MTRYAANTTVATERSRAEIEAILRRYGAASFGYAYDATGAKIGFELHGRRIRFLLPYPPVSEFSRTPTGKPRTRDSAATALDQALRQRWRALVLVIKAKLEAVEAGITTLEDEFLAHIVLPDGSTVGERTVPQIASAYSTGQMPPLLEGPR